jgi:glycosyltransferase involved in cell wall biosynthesis
MRLRRVLRSAAAICTDSMASQRDIAQIAGPQTTEACVIHPGIARVFLEPPNVPLAEVGDKYGLRGQPYIMYAGGLDFRKNIPVLVDAFAELAKTDAEHDLLLVGETGANRRYYPDIDGLVAKQGLGDRVKRLSGVTDEELAVLYAHADVFVFPSRFEGFGLPPLEAMACGAPVICSNATSLPEVVGDAAELFAPVSVDGLLGAMQRVLTDRDWADELRARGRRRAELLTWERTAEQMLAVFRQVVARAGRQ